MRQPARQGDRRQVSVLFTDMVGYTAIVEELGEERSVAFTKMIYDTLSQVVQDAGGSVRSFAGDSIMAVFGIPEALEDAPLRACRAALAIHAAFEQTAERIAKQFGVRPQMRVGISSGAAVMASVEGEGAQLTAVGNTVNLASRIQALAPSGGVLICDTTRRLVEWLVKLDFQGEHKVKGVKGQQILWSLQSVHEGATRFDASLAQGLSHYVGRDAELATMSEALQRAEDNLSVVDLVAEPGLGKTRLLFEFLRRVDQDGVTILTGHCSADGKRVPFFPFLEVTRRSFRITDKDEPEQILLKLSKGLRGANLYSEENLGLMLNLLGLEPPEGALEGLDGVLIGLRTRDLFPILLEEQCKRGMVILQIEDTHWIDSASEELLSKLIESASQSNLLVIQTRRPEYVPAWVDAPVVKVVALKPLVPDDIRHIAQRRLGVDDLPDALIKQVSERAGGNPLFGEEILSFLSEQGALRVSDGRVEFDAVMGESGLPLSMQGLLTARMDRLEPEDRALLQAAAAIGRRFDPGLLSMVVTDPEATGPTLRRLQAQDIVHREPNRSDYIFKHVLLRDTVYQSLLSEPKAALHLAIGNALEERSEGRLTEAADTLAFHFARTDRKDLAFKYAAMAGKKGLGLFTLGEAHTYFSAALALYEADTDCATPDAFAAMLADYALCSNISLHVNSMLQLADRVAPFLKQHGDSRHHVHFLHHYLCCLIWNGRYLDALDTERQLSQMAERLGDRDVRAYAVVSELAVSCYTGHLSSAAFEAKRPLAEELLADLDDAYLRNFFQAHVAWNAVCRGRIEEARNSAEEMILQGVSRNDPRSLGYGTGMKALIALMSDDYEQAYEIARQAHILSRVQFEITIADAAMHAALIPLQKDGAKEEVQHFVDTCTERGWMLFMSNPCSLLGVAMAMEGRISECLTHIEQRIVCHRQEGYMLASDRLQLLLGEVYLQILAGEGDASMGVLLRNARSIAKIMMVGARRIPVMVEQMRSNSMFDPNGHHVGRAEMLLGLLYMVKKKPDLARQHLSEAQRIIAPAGPSPVLARIEDALAELPS